MTTGLEHPFYVVSSVLSGNSVTTSLGLNLLHTLGVKHNYNNGSGNIIVGLISKESGVAFEEFTQENLFKKIGLIDYRCVTTF